MRKLALRLTFVAATATAAAHAGSRAPEPVATFSIAAADPESGEVGVAVASKFFAVGAVVPHVKAGAGAIATQAYANTTYGPKGLELLASGMDPYDVLQRLTRDDDGRDRRQAGIVSARGDSATYTGRATSPWAGGRHGKNFAVQGNILTSEYVVAEMERAFRETKGDLADKLYAALVAGDKKGGDSRGRQSAAMVVARKGGGYGGFSDRYIDIRVDDHASPVFELGRLLDIAHVNGLWNRAWTAFEGKRFDESRPIMERTVELAERSHSSVLAETWYDLACIRGAAGAKDAGVAALGNALAINPRLAKQARADKDLDSLRQECGFSKLVGAE